MELILLLVTLVIQCVYLTNIIFQCENLHRRYGDVNSCSDIMGSQAFNEDKAFKTIGMIITCQCYCKCLKVSSLALKMYWWPFKLEIFKTKSFKIGNLAASKVLAPVLTPSRKMTICHKI